MHLTRERIAFVHWTSDASQPLLQLIVGQPGAYEIVDIHGRRPLPDPHHFQWADARTWPATGQIIVPTSNGLSILDLSDPIKETASPPLIESDSTTRPSQHGPVQWLYDKRGLLAWIPPDHNLAASKGALRFVEGKWHRLGEEHDFPSNILHLIPMEDGSVLQILAGHDGAVTFHVASLDPANVDEDKINALVDQLSAADEADRDKAYIELTRYGPGSWPVIRKIMDDQVAETKIRLQELLNSQLAPTLGGMTLVDGKMRLVGRYPDRGVLFHAPRGVSIPHGPDRTPHVVWPAWIWIHPGEAIQTLDERRVHDLDAAKDFPFFDRDDWIVVNADRGPELLVGPVLTPLLHKSELEFRTPIGSDRRGRWIFKNAAPAAWASAATDADATLILDPTLPDVTPRLPVYRIHDDEGTIGWNKDNWPVRKAGGAWALEADRSRTMNDNEPVYTRPDEIPAVIDPSAQPATQPSTTQFTDQPTTSPSTPPTLATTHPASTQPTTATPTAFPTLATTTLATQPASTQPTTTPLSPEVDLGPLLLIDPAGNRYYDGQKTLTLRTRQGMQTIWPLPEDAQGTLPPTLIQTKDGLLFLFNAPGRVLRLRPTPAAPDPFTLEATFTHKIPNTDHPTRIWLDPAGRIIIAHDTHNLAILFPQGTIPRPIKLLMPASEQDDEETP